MTTPAGAAVDTSARRAAPSPAMLAALIAQIAFGLVAMTICLPSMPDWGREFGASTSAVQLSFSGFVLAYGVFQLLYGPLSDRLGRRPVLLAGLAVAAAGSVVAALAPSLPALVAARVLQGAGAAAGMVVGRALVQDLFQGPERTRVMGFVGMAMGLCPPGATLLGGQLHERLGWAANFWFVAALALVLAAASWRLLPTGRSAAHAAPTAQTWACTMAAAYARLLRERAYLRFVGILGLTTATFYAFLGGAPQVLAAMGVGPAQMGWVIMAIPLSYIVGNGLATRWARGVGDRRLMRWGQVLSITGLALGLGLALTGVPALSGPVAFAAPLVLLGLGHGLLMPPTLAGTVGVVPALAGAAAAGAGLTQQLTGALGGYAVGFVPHDGAAGLLALMLGFTLLAAAVQRWGATRG
ncbi:MAG: MFS transporter [Burkholderiaceae bacterium]|nr:MFS transporter [Burkholderiaceae bacterium]